MLRLHGLRYLRDAHCLFRRKLNAYPGFENRGILPSQRKHRDRCLARERRTPDERLE